MIKILLPLLIVLTTSQILRLNTLQNCVTDTFRFPNSQLSYVHQIISPTFAPSPSPPKVCSCGHHYVGSNIPIQTYSTHSDNNIERELPLDERNQKQLNIQDKPYYCQNCGAQNGQCRCDDSKNQNNQKCINCGKDGSSCSCEAHSHNQNHHHCEKCSGDKCQCHEHNQIVRSAPINPLLKENGENCDKCKDGKCECSDCKCGNCKKKVGLPILPILGAGHGLGFGIHV